MMRRLLALTLICVVSQVHAAPQLPGAQPIIEAADYSSLQTAIDAVPRTGGMLRLPPGKFVITQPLVIQHDDFRMEGAGTATHIENANTNGLPAIIVRSDAVDETNPLRPKPLWRVMFSDFRLSGNKKSGHGIEAVWVNELFVQAVTISYHGGDGIRCHFCVEDMRLNDSLITYNKGAGLRVQGNHDTIVSANHFEENTDGVVFTDGFNLTMSGNNLDDHLRHGVVIESSMGSLVTANMIEQCGGAGLVLARDTYGVTVSGNLFAQNFGGGADLRDAHGIPITGNTFVRCKQFGVRVSSSSGRSAIQGNTFCDTFAGEGPRQSGPRGENPDVNEAAGILLEATRDITISGNAFSGLMTKPLTESGDCERVLFEHTQAVACTDVDAKVIKTLGTGPESPLSTSVSALRLVAVLHDESAFAGAHDIEIQDGIAYIAGKGFTARALPSDGVYPYEKSKGGSIAIVDVKQPEVPKLLWSAPTPLAYEDAETVLPLGANHLLVGARDLFAFDVSIPSNPRQITAINDRPLVDTCNGFARLGDTVFGANKQGFVFVVETSTPDSIRPMGARATRERGELGQPHDVAMSGDLLIVVSPETFGSDSKPGKLAVYRVVDPRTRKVLPVDRWVLVGQLEHPRLAGANRVMTRGNFAYVGSSLMPTPDRTDDLRPNTSIIDLTDPAKPSLRGSLDFPDPRGPNGLEIMGKIVFAAGGQTVQAIDVSNSNTPTELARFASPAVFSGGQDDAHDLVYHAGHLFITAQNTHSLVILKVREDLLPEP